MAGGLFRAFTKWALLQGDLIYYPYICRRCAELIVS